MTRSFPSPVAEIACLLLPTLWFGLIMGVSFLATPAKFEAPTLTFPVALDVGRVTFAIWNNVEWLLLAIVGLTVLAGKAQIFLAAAIGVLDVLILIQSMILLPVLNNRAASIMAGSRPHPSSDHLFYIAIDILKLLILAAMIWKQGERMVLLLQNPR